MNEIFIFIILTLVIYFYKNITKNQKFKKTKKKPKETLPAKFKFPMLNEVGVAW